MLKIFTVTPKTEKRKSKCLSCVAISSIFFQDHFRIIIIRAVNLVDVLRHALGCHLYLLNCKYLN